MKKTFRLFIYLWVPVVAIFLFELSLRLFSNSNQLFIACKENPNFLEINNNFNDAQLNISAKQNWIQKHKDNKTIRVFVIQPATKLSFPKNPTNDFSHLLQFYLQNSFPDRNLELINIPLSSGSSYAEFEIARHLPKYQPDLVILFPGMDEYDGEGAIGSGSKISGNTTLYRLVNRLNIINLFRLNDSRKSKNELYHEKQISVAKSKVLKYFETNLEDMVASLHHSDIPVMLVNSVSNIQDHQPADSFAAENYPASFKNQFEDGKEAYQKGDFELADLCFSKILKKDKTNASVCFYLGKIAMKHNNLPLAEGYFRKALEMDRIKTRPEPEINRIIFKIAVTEGCSLIEVDKYFAEFSQARLPGKNLFYGPVEKRLLANALTARECFNKIIEGNILKQGAANEASLKRSLPITPFDSAYDCFMANRTDNDLDYNKLNIITNGTNSGEEFEEKTANLYLNKKKSWEACMNNLYHYYLSNRNFPMAFKVIENMAIENPYNSRILEMASDTASYLNKPQLVIYYAKRAYNLKPDYKTAKLLFLNFLIMDRPESALPYIIYARNNKLCPDDLSLIYSTTNRIIDLKMILSQHPADIGIQCMIGKQYLAMGNSVAAEKYGYNFN